ncbi:MAG TPA: hypothetical protein VN642_07475 [Dongiaceae bacterium]|nr:hypothetical protein [Dongiaceae bacterium]
MAEFFVVMLAKIWFLIAVVSMTGGLRRQMMRGIAPDCHDCGPEQPKAGLQAESI